MNNGAYEDLLKSLGFNYEEIAALGVIDSFGIIDTMKGEFRWSKFNNTYYKNLLAYGRADKNMELPSDQFLLKKEYKEFINKFAGNQRAFFKVFEEAFLKSTRIGWTKEDLGEVEDYFNTFELRNP